MQITILAFGQLSEIIPVKMTLPPSVRDTDALKQYLLEHFPALGRLHFAIAVNEQLATINAPVPENAVIAVLPPYSGG